MNNLLKAVGIVAISLTVLITDANAFLYDKDEISFSIYSEGFVSGGSCSSAVNGIFDLKGLTGSEQRKYLNGFSEGSVWKSKHGCSNFLAY